MSSPVATSALEVSMPHQPATFSFPEHRFSAFVSGWLAGFVHGVDRYIIMRLQIVIVPFALYVRMCNGEDAFRKY